MKKSKILSIFLQDFWKLGPDQIWKAVKCRVFFRLGFLRLKKIFICPSHECNANCVHCYEKFNHNKFQKALTTVQIQNIIDQFCKLGGYFVFFCSGEFLLRKDSLDLIKYARSKSMIVSVTTNGLLLDKEKIDALKKAGLSLLVVSLDSANVARHDQLRGVNGCFEKAINGIKLARKKGLMVWVWSYVSKTNYDEANELAKFKIDGKSELNIYTFFPLLSGKFFNKFDENFNCEERESFRKKFNNSSNVLLEFPSENDSCVGGGKEHICVMPSGDMTFCPPVPYSYGNIETDTLKDCLKKILKDYKRFSHCKGQCIVNFPEYRNKCNAKFIYKK